MLQAAVIGMPDEKWGELVTAVIVRKPGAEVTEDEIVAQCRSRLASFKRPRKVIFLDDLPQTVSGKIRKNVLRDQVTPAQLLTRATTNPSPRRRNPCLSTS